MQTTSINGFAVRASKASAAVLAFSALLLPLRGQEPEQTPADPAVQQNLLPKKNKQPKKEKQSAATSNDRLFFTLPNFMTLEHASDAPPLTVGQKFSVTARDTFDPVQIAWYGLQSGIAQLKDSDPSYGQGAEGYAKRFGQRLADNSIENFFTHSILPSVLHQDPRYYQLGEGGFLHRAGYAVSRIFVTRSDAGATQFNFSEIFGSAAAAAISSYSYHPADARNLTSAADVWGTQVGWDALSYALKEFWPDIRRKVHPNKASQ